MIFHVTAADSPAEFKRRKAAYNEVIRQYGAKVTGEAKDAPAFSVSFPEGTSRKEIAGFVDAVSRIAGGMGENPMMAPADILVELEPGDGAAIGRDKAHGAAIDHDLKAGAIAAEVLPSEIFDIADTATGPSVESFSEAQQDQLYHDLQVERGEIENGDIYAHRPEASAEDFGAGDLDAQLEKFQKSGEAARWHRQRGF